ncbi:uncharacterized protein LOC128178352 [Crassostrea angulata]|uniref:uncharacterized protein LOC128178352 n=1 Tax=Magallana angulata TaxID=2784310 RepID=UPI0022B13640|nr:uncharacterized protein LOC128178352 [Crassostrea angulata]
MPGSETALKELVCKVLGDHLQAGFVSKLADDLYCEGNTQEELLQNWISVMSALNDCGLTLTAGKIIICPRSTTILGWILTRGRLSASPHKVSVLSTCKLPDTVHGLRSFIVAYKMLSRFLPSCSHTIAPLESAISGLQSKDKIKWSEELIENFNIAQSKLKDSKEIYLPRRDDHLWIITDGSVSKCEIGATLYIMCDDKVRLAGFFSAELRKH